MATLTNNTTEEFARVVKDWIAAARHPKTGRLYTEMVYQPMIELLAYLRANGFKTFIVSGGEADFMRPWTENVYGIPPEQVVGSSMKTRFEPRNGKPVIVRLPEIDLIDVNAGKPLGIDGYMAAVPSRHAATPTATCKCSSGRPPAAARGWRSSCTIPTPSASGPTIARHPWAVSTSRSTRRRQKAGP